MILRVVYILVTCYAISNAATCQYNVRTIAPHLHCKSIDIDDDQLLHITDVYQNVTKYNGTEFITETSPKEPVLADSDPYRTQREVDQPAQDLDIIISTKTQIGKNEYVLTDNKGELYILKNGKLRKYEIADLPLLPRVSTIKKVNEKLIIGTEDRGLYIWDEPQYMLYHIDTIGGLVSNQVVDIAIDKDSNIWAATTNGVSVVIGHNNPKHQPPILRIISGIAGQKSAIENSTLTVDHGSIRFNYEGVDLLKSKEIEYQWTLDSDANNWSPYTSEQQVAIDHLEAGRYTFQVKATTDRKYFSYSKEVPFVIKGNFWSTYWPYIFGGLAGTLLLWGLSYYYHNREIEQLKRERDKIVVENKLLRSERKTLQLQMNPHFIFNTLSAVQGLIALNENKKARKHLQSFSGLMRRMLDQSRDEKITLQHEVAFLEQYLSLEKLARNDRFEYVITVEDSVNIDESIPPMLIQPIVENAIVHGLKGLNRTGLISIEINKKDGELQGVVNDNGVGRSLVPKSENHTSHATHILQERIGYHRPQWKEVIRYTDHKDENQEPQGTTVHIKIPIL